jgi:arsenate reductase (thioredoxin)
MKLLFLCVANSARSQMAEGLARTYAPAGTQVFSAGSEPTRVRPQAVAVLREIGLDIQAQHPKGIKDVHVDGMDLVITLCADEVCPMLPGTTRHLHWPLPDPTGAGENAEEELQAFRDARDAIKQRLDTLFADWNGVDR